MSNFNDTREELNRVRANQETARSALFAATQKRSRLDTEIAQLKRRTGAGRKHARLAHVLQERDTAHQRVRQHMDDLSALDTKAEGIAQDFAKQSDPRDAI